MTTLKRLLVTGLVAYVLFVLATFPAQTALGWFAPDGLGYRGVRGSVWNGRAQTIWVDDLIEFGETSWQWRWSALLGLRVGWRLEARRPDGFLNTNLTLGPTGSARLVETQSALPLAVIASRLPDPNVEGDLVVDLEELEIEDGWPVYAQGSVTVGNLVSLTAGGLSLGSFTLELSTQSEAIQGDVKSIAGPLDVEGTLALTPDRNYTLDLMVGVKPDAPEQLRRQLPFSGTGSQDRLPLSFSGSL